MNDSGPEVCAPAPLTHAPRGRRVENSYPMPQPALRVRPASWTFFRMSSIESLTTADTVQLIVDVAGLWSCAPAFEMIRPAGIAPRASASWNRANQCSRASGVASTSARVRATRR